MKFSIDQSFDKQRLDKVLSVLLADTSRNTIALTIEQGNVTINGKVVTKVSTKVKENDEIEFVPLPTISLDVNPVKMDLDIIYEDHDIIVINKPKGMVVHPANGHHDDTLVNALLAHCDDLSGINGVLRPGIVHRLDKDTTGVLVACKNDKAHAFIAQQFKDHTVTKVYTALVEGIIVEQAGRINAPIARDSKHRQKMGIEEHGKEAITEFEVLQRFSSHTLVKCHLLTGRTHQIRVHMAYINHPVVNDPLYGHHFTKDVQGQYLHSTSLTLIHPTTLEEMTFEAPLPSYFLEASDQL